MIDQLTIEKYTAVIGLEVHAQLSTNSKIFSSDSAKFGDSPNVNISAISLAHPGSLPKLNREVVTKAIKMGLACNCEIALETIFDRKNYFYPDLPKGYQITQDRAPLCKAGQIPIRLKNGDIKSVRLIKIHMEEDAGKSIHLEGEPDTLIDLNRAGVPLIEIVTEPDMRSSEEAAALLSEIRRIVRYLEICDGNMEEGSLRCDANISVMLKNSTQFGSKVEVKNMNSIRNVQKAIDYEIERQIGEIERGNSIVSETRLFDASSGATASMRTKETLTDYRYFPEPDLSPLTISEEWLEEIRATIRELPMELFEEFTTKYQLPHYDAAILVESKEFAGYYREMVLFTENYKSASNWMMGTIKSYLNDTGIEISGFPLKPIQVAEMINMVDRGKITHKAATQQIFNELLRNPQKSAETTAEELNLLIDEDSDYIGVIIEGVIGKYPDKVGDYKKGRKNLIGLFMGEAMREIGGKADPKTVNRLLREALDKK